MATGFPRVNYKNVIHRLPVTGSESRRSTSAQRSPAGALRRLHHWYSTGSGGSRRSHPSGYVRPADRRAYREFPAPSGRRIGSEAFVGRCSLVNGDVHKDLPRDYHGGGRRSVLRRSLGLVMQRLNRGVGDRIDTVGRRRTWRLLSIAVTEEGRSGCNSGSLKCSRSDGTPKNRALDLLCIACQALRGDHRTRIRTYAPSHLAGTPTSPGAGWSGICVCSDHWRRHPRSGHVRRGDPLRSATEAIPGVRQCRRRPRPLVALVCHGLGSHGRPRSRVQQ